MIWGLSLTIAIWWGQELQNFPFQLFWEMFRHIAEAALQNHLPGISKIFRFAAEEMLRSANYARWRIPVIVHIQNQWENMLTLVLLLEKFIVKCLVSRHFLTIQIVFSDWVMVNALKSVSWGVKIIWDSSHGTHFEHGLSPSQPSVVTCKLAFCFECEVSSPPSEQNCLLRMWHKWGGSRPYLATFTVMVQIHSGVCCVKWLASLDFFEKWAWICGLLSKYEI